jgi:uncharacterized protein YjbI with pentapeptide repeats
MLIPKICYTVTITGENATHCEATNMDAKEVLRRHGIGERDFREQDWQGINLSGACLRGIDLTGSNLRNSDLGHSDFTGANLNFACLKGSNVKGILLKGATMPDGRLHNDYLESANYFG